MSFANNADMQAYKYTLSKRQIRLLNYIAENGTIILEKAYSDLQIPKPTTGYHLQRLESFGLIEPVKARRRGRVKPVRLTELGQAIVHLHNGEPISDDFRMKLTVLELVVSLGLRMLTKEELGKAVDLFKDYLEKKGEKPHDEMQSMVI